MRRDLNNIGGRGGRFDYTLSEEEYQEIQKELVRAVRPKQKARIHFGDWYTEPKGIGVQEYGYDTLSEMSAAELTYNFKDPDFDILNIVRSTIKVPILERAGMIMRRDLDSARRQGRALDTMTIEEAGFRVNVLENTLIYQGWSRDGGSTYSINGFYQGAGSDFSTTADYGTAGKAIIATSGAIALSEAQNIEGPYKNILNGVQFAQLNSSVLSSGVREKEIVRDLLNDDEDDLPSEGAPFKGILTKASQIAAGTGLLVGNNPNGARIIVAADMQTEDWAMPPTGTKVMVWEALVPLIYNSYTFTKMSVI